MSQGTSASWKHRFPPDADSQQIEDVLKGAFQQVDAYRYNSGSIRVRVIDPRFDGLTNVQRDGMVEPYFLKLPERIQQDIVNLLTLSPAETTGSSRKALVNLEFEDPAPSVL